MKATPEPCPGGTPDRIDVAALTDKPVGKCPGCCAWLYLHDGSIPSHERSVLA